MPLKKPTRVQLRNDMYATVLERGEFGPFRLRGELADKSPDLWREDGRWREDGVRHPFDIIKILSPSGKVIHVFKA